MNLFRPVHVAMLLGKILLIGFLTSKDMEQSVRDLPFFSTKFSDYSRVDEAHYFIDQSQDPYQIEHIFQKPLLVYFLQAVKNIPGAVTGIFLLCDLIIAELISHPSFILNKEKNKEKHGRIQMAFRVIYHLNPLSFLAVYTKWTSIFEITAGLLAVYYSINTKKSIISSFFFALCVYLNPILVLLIVPLICGGFFSGKKSGFSASHVFQTLLFIGLFLLGSLFLTGSTKFLVTCYLRQFSPNLFQPSCGLLWALFTGMFTNYERLYHLVFFLLPLSHIFPLQKIFSRAIKKNDNIEGISGFITGVCLFVAYFHFSFITLFELNLILTLLFTSYSYLIAVKIFPALSVAVVIIMTLTSQLGRLWFFTFTANPNHVFFQVLVTYCLIVILITEAIKVIALTDDTKKEKQIEQKEKNLAEALSEVS